MNISWYGHSCFKIETGSDVILIDPFLSGNPKFTGSVDEVSENVTHIALTHGHDDHVGDTVQICQKTGATLIAVFELASYLSHQGVANIDPTNNGGTVHHKSFDLTFVKAYHSSSTMNEGLPVYLGNPCGLIIRAHQGPTFYHMGDTEIFGDMALIEELYQPEIGLVPIGDRFTMGARTASLACKKFFHFKTIIPCHYGTFPIIDGSADRFVAEMDDHHVIVPEIGQGLEF